MTRFELRASRATPLLTLLLLLACVQPPNGVLPPPPPMTIPECPVFTVNPQTITVDAGGRTFDLGGGNELRFDRGAVPRRSTYSVSAYRPNGRTVAGVTITPLEGSPATFTEPVELRLSYAGCPFENNQNPFVIAEIRSGLPFSVGGAKSVIGRFVRAYVTHFSDYAIGI